VGYRWVEHTAELELEVEADSVEAVFGEAARALGELLDGRGPPVSYEVALSGTERALLLADWLDELVFRAETERLIPRRVERLELAGEGLQARLAGVRAAPRPLVKGVTHHRLSLERRDGAHRATVVLDV